MEKTLDSVAAQLFTNVKKFTPKRSGLAVKSWRKGNQRNLELKISNKQPYMGKLDRGYSKQAPRGFFKPAATLTKNQKIRRFD